MNRKILMAGGVMAFVAAIALGATYAAWQAQDTIEGNTISTATLSIDAYGAAAYGSDVKPVFETDVLPGDKGLPVDRAIIENNSDVDLDLYFYIEPVAGNPGACDATKIAWRASTPGDGSNWKGYGTAGDNTTYENTSVVGNIGDAGNPTGGTFTLVSEFYGPENAVLIAEGDNGFGAGEDIAMRQIAGFSSDADYEDHSGTCEWTEYFIGTIPGETPAVEEAE